MATAELAAPTIAGPDAQASDQPTKTLKLKKPSRPDDFESDYEFLKYVREEYDKDVDYDKTNRDEAIMDARFMAGDQWDENVKAKRAKASKPTLTINRLPAYVAQLVGNRRLNDTGIKVIPDNGGTKKIADVREGLIRSIQKISRAQYAYDKAFEQQVIGGLGHFQVHLDYAHDDVFEQDIRIAAIPNALAVVWDRASVEPSGSDAMHVFVVDDLPRAEFKRRYPNAQDSDFTELSSRGSSSGWNTLDAVKVISFWRLRAELRTVILCKTGSVEDVTDIPVEVWFDQAMEDKDGQPMAREVYRKYAEMHLCSANDILAGPYKLPVQRVPVFRVPGWELWVENDRKRWGLVRFLRDPQRLHNYWRSTIAEKLTGTSKHKWLAADTAVEGREKEFRESHLSDNPLLIWNADSGQPPVRNEPVQMEPALINEAGIAAQDIKDVSNVHAASLGEQSNEVSGKAIMARQRVGELGTVIYQDNLNTAIEECGKVINQLIPFVYDTPRIIKVLGEDMLTEKQVPINGMQHPELESVDITLGKYSVTVTTGPSYTTRRVEAREEMMAMVNAMPDTMKIFADLIIEAQDWPGSDKIAKRARMMLPPGMLPEDEMDDEMRAQQQAAQQKQQQQDQLQQAAIQLEMTAKQLEIEETKIKILETQARIEQILAQADQAKAAAVAAIAGIETARVQATFDMVDRLNPEPPAVTNGAKK